MDGCPPVSGLTLEVLAPSFSYRDQCRSNIKKKRFRLYPDPPYFPHPLPEGCRQKRGCSSSYLARHQASLSSRLCRRSKLVQFFLVRGDVPLDRVVDEGRQMWRQCCAGGVTRDGQEYACVERVEGPLRLHVLSALVPRFRECRSVHYLQALDAASATADCSFVTLWALHLFPHFIEHKLQTIVRRLSA